MPQTSALYGVARIRSAERTLINRERLRRFLEMSADEMLRQLVESGYGAMPDATPDDTEALIASELVRAYDLVREVTTDPAMTDIFLMDADIHNLKLLIKLRMTGSRDEPALMHGGIFDEKMLKKCVEEGEYSPLPELLREALASIEESLIGSAPDPARVSTVLDDAYIRYAYKYGNAFVKEYFAAFADFTNIATLMRVRAMKGERGRFASLIIAPGEISRETLMRAFELPYDAVSRLVCSGKTKDAMARGIEAAAKTGHIANVERERDDYLIRLASAGKDDTDTVRPIVGYLIAKRQEARDVRLVLTTKRNGLPDEVINERMRLLYGE